MAGLKLVCITVVCMVLASAAVDAAISCNQVSTIMAPCIDYARGFGSTKIPGCCFGIRKLIVEAKTAPDRQALCKCLKTLASTSKGIDVGILDSLPLKCGVFIPYKLSPSTDCSRVN